MAADDCPLTEAEWPALFAGLETASGIALAVSGGPDSMALLHVAAAWRRSLGQGPALLVLTVDHRLRAGSAAEAEMVMAAAARLDLPAQTLVWRGAVPTTGLEEAARNARYDRLAAAAQAAGASHIVTAHHLDDQAETFLLRLGGGSGIAGLGGMRRERPLGVLTLVRPFLGVPKARLAATARAAGLPWVDDPMNADPRYARARLRALRPALAAVGLDNATLARAAARMARADAALEQAVGALLGRVATVGDTGAVTVDLSRLGLAPEEIRLRVLTRTIMAAGGGAAPRTERVEALERALRHGRPLRRTLGGAVITADGDRLVATREWGRQGLPAIGPAATFAGLWDGRFRIRFAGEPLTIGPLGTDARRFAASSRSQERAILAATPVLRAGERLVAAPLVGLPAPPGADLAVESIVAARLGLGGAPAAFTSS